MSRKWSAGNLDVLGYNYMNHRVPNDEQIFTKFTVADECELKLNGITLGRKAPNV